jgi:hypothetical protein
MNGLTDSTNGSCFHSAHRKKGNYDLEREKKKGSHVFLLLVLFKLNSNYILSFFANLAFQGANYVLTNHLKSHVCTIERFKYFVA